MNNRLLAYSVIPVVILATVFITLDSSRPIDFTAYSVECLDLDFNVSEASALSDADDISIDFKDCFYSPKLDKSFIGFKEALAFKESRGDYFTVNTLGYLGKYQFGKNTLKLIGVYNTSKFLNNPELQEKAFIANAARNKWILRRDIKRFVGQHIDGVLITESGVLAAAHLAGPGSVKKYLRSYGAIGFADAYGTTIGNYMKKFSGYDTSFIVGDRKAKASLL
ncbi:MAG: peptidoglycan-binding protein LysM [Bacteroidetes bacterium]|nr:MAG: peptidoglycan-binding protein LysM [Bacteroidota bacterium]